MPKSKARKKKKQRPRGPTAPSTPEAKYKEESPRWYVVLMFGLILIGGLIIILNYIGLTPGETSNAWLIAGLAGIAVGFGMTLNYH